MNIKLDDYNLTENERKRVEFLISSFNEEIMEIPPSDRKPNTLDGRINRNNPYRVITKKYIPEINEILKGKEKL